MAYDPYAEPDIGTLPAPSAPSSSPGSYDPYAAPGVGDNATPQPRPSLLSRTWSNIVDAASSLGAGAYYAGDRVGAGLNRGLNDVLDAPTGWLMQQAANVGARDQSSVDDAKKQMADERAQFERDYGDSNLAGAGRIAGQTAVVAPLLATGEGALTAGAARLGPAVTTAANYLTGTGGSGLVTRGLSLAGQGATQGAVSNVLTAPPDESTGDAALKGAAAGAILGPAVTAAMTPVRAVLGTLPGMVTTQIARLGALARSYGIDVDPAMLPTNQTYRTFANETGRAPFSGAQAAIQNSRQQWQQAVANQFGENAPNGITYDVMDQAARRIGQDFDTVAARTTIPNDPQLNSDMAGIMQDFPAWGLTRDQTTRVGSQIRNIYDAFQQGNGQLSGQAYQNLTRRGGPLDSLVGSNDPTEAGFGMRIRGVLDDAFQRSASPQDQDLLTQARQQYRAMKTVQPLVEQRGATGDINPSGLLQRVRQQSAKYDPSNSGLAYTGGGPMGDLASIGNVFFSPAPDSGTAQRNLAIGILTGKIFPENWTGLAATGVGLAANRGVQTWLRSPRVGQNMINTALAGNQPRTLGTAAIPGLLGYFNQ